MSVIAKTALEIIEPIFFKTRIAIMNHFDKKSLPCRALKNY